MSDFKDAMMTAAVILAILLMGFGIALADRYMDSKTQPNPLEARIVKLEAEVVSLEVDVGLLISRIDKQRECMCSLRRPGDVKDIQPPYGEKK